MKSNLSLFCLLLSTLLCQSLIGQTRYWVGGTGYWHHASNWSLTSGGAGGASVPTASDDAIFDANSFSGPSTVTLPTSTNQCRHIDFSQITAAVSFEGSDLNNSKLYVYGNFTGSTMLSSTLDWLIEFTGSAACEIETMGTNLPNVFIEGIDKEVNVVGDLNCHYLTLNGCQLDLNENNLTVNDFINIRYGQDSVFVDMSNSTVSCGKWDPDDLDQEVDIINIDHTNGELICGTFLPGRYIDYNNVTLDGNLTVFYEETEIATKVWSNNNADCTFNDLSLVNSEEFSVDGSLVINNNLKIESGCTLTWDNGDVVTIHGNIELTGAAGSCTNYTLIKGQSPSVTFSLSNHVTLDYVNMQDCSASGTGSLTIQGSDLGGCSNIIFTGPPPQNYYWVGGAGLCYDLNHWATSSGGSVFHTCYPTVNDNLIIDSNSGVNSGETIEVSGGTFRCNNFTIVGTASPNIELDGSFSYPANIMVYGDLTFTPTTSTTYDGTFNNWYLNGESNININTHNIDLFKLIIENTTGDIHLLSALKASNACQLLRGNLYTNQHDITAGILFAGGGCSGNNCPEKDWHLDGSTLTVDFFKAGSNYGSLYLMGNYEIFAGEFDSSPGMDYDAVTITDKDISTYHFEPRGSTFRKLTIDNEYTTRIHGNLSITDTFTLVNQSDIIFSASPTFGGQFIEILGDIITPDPDICGKLTKLYADYDDDYNVKRPSGLLEINNVLLENIGTTTGWAASPGSTQFNAVNSVVVGTAEEWNITPPSSGNDMYWIGGNGLWDYATNWSLSSGGLANSNGCIPSAADHVYIDDNNFTADNQTIYLPSNATVNCKSLTYNNTTWNGTSLFFSNDNSGNNETTLAINQSLNISNPWIIHTGINRVIAFVGNDLSIDTDGTLLPKIDLFAGDGDLELLSDLQTTSIEVHNGTFKSNNYDVESGSILSNGYKDKHYDFGNSTITVNGLLDLGTTILDNVTYDADGAHIICQDLYAESDTFNILELINPTTIATLPKTYHINQLILSGGEVEIPANANFSVDHLTLNNDNAILAIQNNNEITLHESITSNITGVTLPSIKADGITTAEINIDNNICVTGELQFENIEVTGDYIMHAPDATDNGGNINIDFNTYTDNSTLYWIGGSGVFQHQSNWSNNSGTCPTSIAPATASLLIFDNNSFRPDESTITFSSNVTIGDMLFTNSNVEVDIVIPFRLKPNSITVDGGMVKQRDNNNNSLTPALQLDEHLEVINGGSYTLEQSILHCARRPTDMTQAALQLSADSKLHAPNSLILISGHPTGNTDPAVLLPSAADIDLSTTELKTFKPVGTGQPNNDMSFDLGGHTIQKFTMDNAFALAQQIKLISNCHLKSVQLENGELRVADGVVVEVD